MAKIKVGIVENVDIVDLKVIIGGVDFGSFEQLPGSDYFYCSKLQHKLTGDHYIAIGEALNKINQA